MRTASDICAYVLMQRVDSSILLLKLMIFRSGDERNHLVIANVQLPTDDAHIDSRKYDEEKGG